MCWLLSGRWDAGMRACMHGVHCPRLGTPPLLPCPRPPGTSLRYKPGFVAGGGLGLEHDCGTSRAIGYFLEPLALIALWGKKPLTITLRCARWLGACRGGAVRRWGECNAGGCGGPLRLQPATAGGRSPLRRHRWISVQPPCPAWSGCLQLLAAGASPTTAWTAGWTRGAPSRCPCCASSPAPRTASSSRCPAAAELLQLLPYLRYSTRCCAQLGLLQHARACS